MKTLEKASPIHFEWRWHDNMLRRVWRTDWFGDQFELLNEGQFQRLLVVAQQFSFKVVEASDD